MSVDTNPGKRDPEPPEGRTSRRRSLHWRDWVETFRFLVGAALVAIGVLVAGFGAIVPDAVLSDVTTAQLLFVGVSVVVVGAVVAVSGYRLTTRQQQYLTRADREQKEIRGYLRILEGMEPDRVEGPDASEAEPPTGTAEEDGVDRTAEEEGADRTEGSETVGPSPPSAAGRASADLPSLAELRQRLELAVDNLDEAKGAAYRRDYASFLSLYYEASRQELLLYDVLDGVAEGWAFGLDVDGEDGDRDPGPETATAPAPHRRWNLGRRIRSFARESLPGQRRRLAVEYLGGSGTLPTSWELYYAVRVLHEWNVSRHERALHVKRFLRLGIAVLSAVLVGLAVVLPRAFEGGFVGRIGAPAADGTAPANATTTSTAAASATTTPTATVGPTSSPAVNETAVAMLPGVVSNDNFLLLLLLAGALGAVFSMLLRSFGEFYTLTTDPSVPEPVFMLEALVARTLVGGVSALVLFVIARSELGAVVLASSLLESPESLLLLGFVAGLSERFVKRSLDEVVDRVGGEGSGGEGGAETPPGPRNPPPEGVTGSGVPRDERRTPGGAGRPAPDRPGGPDAEEPAGGDAEVAGGSGDAGDTEESEDIEDTEETEGEPADDPAAGEEQEGATGTDTEEPTGGPTEGPPDEPEEDREREDRTEGSPDGNGNEGGNENGNEEGNGDRNGPSGAA